MSGIMFILLLLLIGISSAIVSTATGLGTLISYPSLLAMGLPPVLANITIAFSTITGNYSSVFASVKDLHGHKTQLMIIVPLSLIGSVLGAFGLFAIQGIW